MNLIAINPKNQSKVNRILAWATKYDIANNNRDIADGDGDDKAYKKYDRQCQMMFDKYLELMDDLPKGQQKAIEKLWS